MDAEIKKIPLVLALAAHYPFSRGGVRRQGRYYGLFATAEPDHARLLTPGQIEYVVWTLAAIPEEDLTPNQVFALGKYAPGLERARQGEMALARGWINPGCLFEVSPEINSSVRPVCWLPEGQPSYLKGKSLRKLLGKRFPYLDDRYKDGAIIHINRFNGDAGIIRDTTRARLAADEILDIIPGGEHAIGVINWDHPPGHPLSGQRGQHVMGHRGSGAGAPKTAPQRPGQAASDGKPKRRRYRAPQWA